MKMNARQIEALMDKSRDFTVKLVLRVRAVDRDHARTIVRSITAGLPIQRMGRVQDSAERARRADGGRKAWSHNSVAVNEAIARRVRNEMAQLEKAVARLG